MLLLVYVHLKVGVIVLCHTIPLRFMFLLSSSTLHPQRNSLGHEHTVWSNTKLSSVSFQQDFSGRMLRTITSQGWLEELQGPYRVPLPTWEHELYIPALIHVHHLDRFVPTTPVFNVLPHVYHEQRTKRQRSALSVRLCLCLREAVDHSE